MTESWIERWQTGRTGWHEAGGNEALQRHWDISGKRVLVPLCGKSLDLLWLESLGNEVVGVEVSPLAVEAFFVENNLAYERRDGPMPTYQATGRRITLHCGDYLRFGGESFDAHYDRGALIALSADDRPRYAHHTSSLLDDGAKQLVITVEYDDAIATGPPFPVLEPELLDYWPVLQRAESRQDIDNAPPKFIEAGLKSMHEIVWRSRQP